MRMIWTMLLGSIALYVGVALFVDSGQRDPAMAAQLALPLAVLAAGAAAASLWLPQIQYTRALRSAVEAASWETTQGRFAEPDVVRERAATLFMTPFIVGAALSESVAIYGLILALLGAPPLHWAPFFVASAVLFVLRIPSADQIELPVEEICKARFR